MNKIKTLTLLVFILSALFSPVHASETRKIDYSILARVPIQHNGRLKPLDTFARVQLLMFSGRQKLKNESAIQWLGRTLFEPRQALKDPIFVIKNRELLDALTLQPSSDKRYSFEEIFPGLQQNFALIQDLSHRARKDRNPFENQLVDLFNKSSIYHQLTQSLTCILPLFKINSPELSELFQVPPGTRLSYLYILSFVPEINNLIDKREKSPELVSAELGDALDQLFGELNGHYSRRGTGLLRIIPPSTAPRHSVWPTPWQIIEGGESEDGSEDFLVTLAKLAAAGERGNQPEFERLAEELASLTKPALQSAELNRRISAELLYNRLDLFTYSLSFYILGLLLLLGSGLGWTRMLYRMAYTTTILGCLLHVVGILLRMYIMARPPVSTLYESVIFVGAIIVAFSLLLERSQKNGIGILLGTIGGTVLHFVGRGYLDDGDTLGMLVAVLNTNFWLATHVVTITIGYGACFITGLVGHVYLLLFLIKPSKIQLLQTVYRNMIGLALISLFFSLFGTILGGIWADQSWGRFWGWDPKENGALLICLWLLFSLHAKAAGRSGPVLFSVMMVILNIVVAIAWFGVNLLSIGLHSYGFTEGIARNLAVFCFIELAFAIVVPALILAQRPKLTSG